jgi:sulfate adenylyltransferase subunit 1 (EFTu-like GTPase family)
MADYAPTAADKKFAAHSVLLPDLFSGTDRPRGVDSGLRVCVFAASNVVTTAALRVKIGASHVQTIVKEVRREFGRAPDAIAGQSIAVTLTSEVHVSWMAERSMVPRRPYPLQIHTNEVTASTTAIKYQEDISTGVPLAAKTLRLTGIGVIKASTSRPLVFEPFAACRGMGGSS